MSRFREQFGDRRVELASPDHSGCLDGPESLEPRPETASRSDVRFRIVATSSMSPVSVPQASPAFSDALSCYATRASNGPFAIP